MIVDGRAAQHIIQIVVHTRKFDGDSTAKQDIRDSTRKYKFLFQKIPQFLRAFSLTKEISFGDQSLFGYEIN
jgi:hypothetical protein